MKKWQLIIDVDKCEDCNNCFLACKDEHVDNEWPGYAQAQPRHGQRWIDIQKKERGQYPLIDVTYRPTPCMHCNDAPCVKASKGAVTKRVDGIVIIDPIKAKGQKEIVKSCPYHVIFWNEEKELPQKCTLCAHLLDEGWRQPRCVQACPTGALRVEHIEEGAMKLIVEAEKLEALHPEYKTRPNVYYKNLYKFTKCFISGSVAFEKEGQLDCAEDAEVTLFFEKEKISEQQTDCFGDFKFDGLSENAGKYILKIQYQELNKKTAELDLKTSINLGTICL